MYIKNLTLIKFYTHTHKDLQTIFPKDTKSYKTYPIATGVGCTHLITQLTAPYMRQENADAHRNHFFQSRLTRNSPQNYSKGKVRADNLNSLSVVKLVISKHSGIH